MMLRNASSHVGILRCLTARSSSSSEECGASSSSSTSSIAESLTGTRLGRSRRRLLGFPFPVPLQSTLSFHRMFPLSQAITFHCTVYLFHFLTFYSRPSLLLSVTFPSRKRLPCALLNQLTRDTACQSVRLSPTIRSHAVLNLLSPRCFFPLLVLLFLYCRP